ncbi:MAG TPA: hypothetical protein VKF15_07365 [Nitrososphaerales archaeon]|nr:hypothetical protein [Nitrososphaerales archaeon]
MGIVSLGLNLYDGIVLGFIATVLIASLFDRFGDAMFRRGVAKPFYILGRRVHHRSLLYVILPCFYALVSLLVLAGYVQIVWGLLWTGIGTTILLAAACTLVDLCLDYASKAHMRRGILHHELIYIVLPAFAFTDFLRLVV